MANFCSFRDVIKESKDGPTSIIEKALVIDTELSGWAARNYSGNFYATMANNKSSPDIFGDHWHVYRDIRVAIIWNHYRTLRIRVSQILISQLGHMIEDISPPSSDNDLKTSAFLTTQIEASKRNIVEVSHDVCASVPFILGYTQQIDLMDG